MVLVFRKKKVSHSKPVQPTAMPFERLTLLTGD
jgi:hypothetical protein